MRASSGYATHSAPDRAAMLCFQGWSLCRDVVDDCVISTLLRRTLRHDQP
jgi:hypothetical protein